MLSFLCRSRPRRIRPMRRFFHGSIRICSRRVCCPFGQIRCTCHVPVSTRFSETSSFVLFGQNGEKKINKKSE
ncbi:hypothetical protein Hanom_Chr13g01191901 [Helianthus anomalus]